MGITSTNAIRMYYLNALQSLPSWEMKKRIENKIEESKK